MSDMDTRVAERSKEIAAENAYLAQHGTDADPPVAVEPVVTPVVTPTPDAKATPAKTDEAITKAARETFAAKYRAEFADATDDEIDDAFADEGKDEGKDESAEGEVSDEEADDVDDEFAAPNQPKHRDTPVDDFASELAKQGVKIKLDDIKDPVARKFIETRLAEMQTGFTRAMQEARAYRKDEVTFRAEQRFQREHPVDHLVSLLLETPGLGEQVNAKLDEMESPTAKKAHDIVVRDAKAQAKTAEETESVTRSQRVERGEQVERYAIRAAEKAGIPYELGIAESIVALVLSRGENGDVTRAEVDQIITDKAAIYERRVRAFKRESRKAYIAQKTEDAKTAGLKLKPGQGAAPGVGKRTAPKSDDEFVAMMSGDG